MVVANQFRQKVFTKEWLIDNTSFLFPKTVVTLGGLKKVVKATEVLPLGRYILKPNIGRQSFGVIPFEKSIIGVNALPISQTLDLVTLAKSRMLNADYHGKWFIEEWIYPREKLHRFTLDPRCPPIFRFVGRPQIHFIGLSEMLDLKTCLAGAYWQDRKYIWLDLEGVIRPLSDMNLEFVDEHSVNIARTKSLEEAPFGLKIAGVKEVVEQINREIAPKIRLNKDRSWSCDGTFNSRNEFVVIEMNGRPGLQFRGFSWNL